MGLFAGLNPERMMAAASIMQGDYNPYFRMMAQNRAQQQRQQLLDQQQQHERGLAIGEQKDAIRQRDHVMGALEQAGVPEQYRAAMALNPETAGSTISGQFDPYTLSPGARRQNPLTGEVTRGAPRYITTPPGGISQAAPSDIGDGTGSLEQPSNPFQDLIPGGTSGDLMSPQDFTAGRMTSGRRTVSGNRAVGGSATSHHLHGNAADFVPAQGQSMAQLYQQARRAWPNAVEILNEGDHVHVANPNWRVPYFGRNGARGRR